jgi:hypothetical protein
MGVSVFRALSLVVALTVAGGPQVGLLCDLVCPPMTKASDCHQDAGLSTGLTTPDPCDRGIPDTLAFARDEGRRAWSPWDPGPALLTVRAEFGGPHGDSTYRPPAPATARVTSPPLVALRL